MNDPIDNVDPFLLQFFIIYRENMSYFLETEILVIIEVWISTTQIVFVIYLFNVEIY
jgi:hypothetical protein